MTKAELPASPDDPEMLNCTCVQRTLREDETVMFYLPQSRRLVVYAKDCPEHGAHWEPEPAC